jgi:hypothetical protein
MQINRIGTIELIELLKANKYLYINVSLILNFGLQTTHTISFRKTHIWDEGIDNLTVKWLLDEFLEQYKNALWVIN